MNLPIGYATAAREILCMLDARGVPVTYTYAYGPKTPWPFTEPEASGDPRLDAIRKRAVASDIVITFAAGNVFYRNRGNYKVGFTMIEVDGFPADWVRQANAMDEVWTPTEFNRRGLVDSGVTKPVHVVPLGVDAEAFHPTRHPPTQMADGGGQMAPPPVQGSAICHLPSAIPQIERIPNRNGDFVFLANFEWGMRKAPEILLRAFHRTFRASEPVILVCKTLNRNPTVDIANEIRALGLDPRGGRIYFLHNRELPHHQLATLYRSADCFVSPSRGEGWGLPLLEAMACGLPAIATDWGGHTAILDPRDTYPLRVRALVSADASGASYYRGRSWAEPDEEHLCELLRHVYEHRDEAREKGLAASERVRRQFTWTETVNLIETRITSARARSNP
jgi:glycosyltransferase involved in cell wall biosynthesis